MLLKTQKRTIVGSYFISKPLSTSELHKLAKTLNIEIKKTSRNMIPKEDGMYIENLDESSGNGTHWVALLWDINDKAIYFDSFGLRPPKEIVKMHNK